MKKMLLFFLTLSLSTPLLANASYIDLTYNDSQSIFPKDRGWFKKLFSDQERKVFLVVSISKNNGSDGNQILLVPPKILESFERSNNDLKRIKSDNLQLLSSHFVNDSEQLVLKVEFFSVKKTQANAFTESLKSLASAYALTNANPEASKVATSAMDAIGSILFDNKEIYLTYNGGVPIDAPTSSIDLYFDNSGNINDSIFSGSDSSNKIVFNVKSSSDISVNFSYSFENQGVNKAEKEAFQDLVSAKGPINQRDACVALRNTLKKRFSNTTANDLTAIAINDIGWAQDETKYQCIPAEIAVKYKRENGLNQIANCTSDECTKTKTTLILLEGNTPAEVIASIVGADVYGMNCKATTDFSRLYRWSKVNSIFENNNFKSFRVNSCLQTSTGNSPFIHTFSWLNGSLASHSCDTSDAENNCN